MKRIFIILAVAAALLVLAPLTWLLGTESGLHWTLARVTPLLPVELSIAEVHGRLIGPITADDVRVHHDDVDVRIGQLELDWTPAALLLGKLRLSRVHARAVDIGLHPTPAAEEPFKLGINLSVADARVEQLSVRRAGTDPIQLARLELAGHASADGFGVSRLYLKREDLIVEMDGVLNLDSEQALNGDIRWSVRLADYPALAGAGSIRGDSKHAVTTQTLAPPFAGRLSAELKDLKTAWHWSAKLELEQLALNQLQAQWPALRVRGQVQARGDAATIQADANLEATQPNYEGVARLDAQLAWH
ncbi:MAG TPA: hypothetical protein VES91_00120, partial [Burkholderiaceae bacterium]|nr:hypothetical protein [Burkholderiaceae bacterium]